MCQLFQKKKKSKRKVLQQAERYVKLKGDHSWATLEIPIVTGKHIQTFFQRGWFLRNGWRKVDAGSERLVRL